MSRPFLCSLTLPSSPSPWTSRWTGLKRSILSAPSYSSTPTTHQGPHPLVPEHHKRHVRKPGDKAWKDTASLIIAAPATPTPTTTTTPSSTAKTDFLVMKRSKGSAFAPNTLCFPGGAINSADSDRSWIDWFRSSTGADLSQVEFMSPSAALPPLYNKKVKNISDFKGEEDLVNWYRDRVPPQAALRIAAIRETFEEVGILITRKNTVEEATGLLGRDGEIGMGYVAGTHAIQDPDELEEWQQKVRANPDEFLNLCKHYMIRPDLNALVEWSNWLTPNSFGYKRFDTIFYMVVLGERVPFLSDAFEVATVRWTSADKVLQGAKDGKAKLIPPQIYELTRLKDTNVQRIQKLMKLRLNLGISRWCPCYIKVNDGIISIFPGDDLYPADYRIEEFEEIRQLDTTLEQIRSSTKKHHRIEFKSEYEFQLVINVGPNLGHIYM